MNPSGMFWQALRGIAPDPHFWTPVIERARIEGVLPYLAALHRDLPNRVEIRRSAAAAEIAREHLLAITSRAMREAEIPWAILKGAELAYRIYDDPADRPSGDCDVLVRPKDRVAAERALTAAGLQASHDHAELWMGPAGAVDLHIAFVNTERLRGRGAAYSGTPKWESRINLVRSRAGAIPALGLDDLAVYLALHLVHHHGGGGARWLVDIARLLARYPETRRVMEGIGLSGRLALMTVDALLGNGGREPELWLDRLAIQGAYEGRAPAGLRFLLSAREMPEWSDRIRFLREAAFPDRRVLRSSTVGSRTPLRTHVARVFKSALDLIHLHYLSRKKPWGQTPIS
jgi:hypothetical protein